MESDPSCLRIIQITTALTAKAGMRFNRYNGTELSVISFQRGVGPGELSHANTSLASNVRGMHTKAMRAMPCR